MSLLVYNNVLFGGTDTRFVWKMDMALSINENTVSDELVVFSNGSKGQFRIYVHTIFDDAIVMVHNLLGQEVMTARDKFANGILALDLSSQPAGLYLLSVQKAEGTVTTKIVKQ